MKYCYHTWAGTAKTSLSNLNRVQKHLCGGLVHNKLLYFCNLYLTDETPMADIWRGYIL